MPATPAYIAEFTTDGVALSRVDTALRVAMPSAVDEGGSEIEMFFDLAADGEVLLEERWQLVKSLTRIHEAVETETSMGLGTTVPLSPAVPRFTLVDSPRGINQTASVRAFVIDRAAERYSVELLG